MCARGEAIAELVHSALVPLEKVARRGQRSDDSADPAARFDMKESVAIAFIATIQLLPPRQRAAPYSCATFSP